MSPPDSAPFDMAAFLNSVQNVGHGAVLRLRFVANGPDWCELALDYRDDLVVDMQSGVLASGPIISLMDTVTSLSIAQRCGRFVPMATLDLRIDYLRRSDPGRTIFGRGECYRMTRRVAFVRGTAHDGDPDHPVAHASGTFMLTAAS